jgi:hypothetical protein
MTFAKRPAAAIVVYLAAVLSGCGESTPPSIPASSHLERIAGNSAGQIVLSQLGAQRIGIQTVPVDAVPAPPPVTKTTIVAGVKHTTTVPAPKPTNGPVVIVPYSAIIYAPTGQSYVFTNTRPLTYVEIPITIDHISGSAAYLLTGPKAGSKVVSVGAEELYGVQTGVIAQT